MQNRRLTLIQEEARRHRAMADLDMPRRLEHMEVAEALDYAAEKMSREDRPCKLAISIDSYRKRSARNAPGRCPAKNQSHVR